MTKETAPDSDVLLTRGDVKQAFGRIFLEPLAVGSAVTTTSILAGLSPNQAISAGAGAAVLTGIGEMVRTIKNA